MTQFAVDCDRNRTCVIFHRVYRLDRSARLVRTERHFSPGEREFWDYQSNEPALCAEICGSISEGEKKSVFVREGDVNQGRSEPVKCRWSMRGK